MARTMTTWMFCLGMLLAVGGCMQPRTPDSTDDGGRVSGPADDGGERTSSTGTLRIINQSSVSVWYLYVSPSSSSSWGSDQLGANVVSPGETFRLNSFEPFAT